MILFVACLFSRIFEQTKKEKRTSRFYFHLFVLFFTSDFLTNALRTKEINRVKSGVFNSLFAQPFDFMLLGKQHQAASLLSLFFSPPLRSLFLSILKC